MAKIQVQRNGTKKAAIITKAAALFRRKGFASSSMRELADSIGVEAASLYNHIGSKQEILQTVCFDVAEKFNMHFADVRAMKGSTIAKVEELIRFHIRMMLNNYDEVYVANHEWRQLPEPALTRFIQQRHAYEHSFIKIIEEGIINKDFRKIHPHVAVLTILSAVRGLEFWHRHNKHVSIASLQDDMVNQLLNGLKS